MEKNIPTSKRVAIIGPESSGKSILTEQLATYYREPFVPEYGRTYLQQIKRPYVKEDLFVIAKGMVSIEQASLNHTKKYLFCDTDLIMMKVWYEHYFGKCDPQILMLLENHPYDLYLITAPDIKWQPDPYRENPHIRESLFAKYVEEVEIRKVPYQIIKGNQRFQLAKNFIENSATENHA